LDRLQTMMILVKRSKTLQVLKLMYLEKRRNCSVFSHDKRQSGWVSGGRTEGLFSMMLVVLVSITGHVLDAISCICLMLYLKKTHLSSLFQMKKQCQ
jgi:hypothetical protein